MNDSIDIILYENLRKRIINNDELSDKEWDLFFYIEERTKSERIKNNEWNKIFNSYSVDSSLKPEEQQELEELKEEYILKNADDIIDYSIGKKSDKFLEAAKKTESISLFNNRQVLFAVSTGFVVLITAILLFSNKEKLYTGDLTANKVSSSHFSDPKSNDFLLDGKSSTRSNEHLVAEASNKELKESASQNNVDYSANSFLEEYVLTDYRGTNNSIKLEQPSSSEYVIKGAASNLIFKGQMISKFDDKNSLVLKIFDNSEKNYINDKPMIEKEVTVEKTNEGQKFFDVKIASNLKPGLYYYMFEDSEDNIFYVGKILVKK